MANSVVSSVVLPTEEMIGPTIPDIVRSAILTSLICGFAFLTGFLFRFLRKSKLL